MPNALKAGTVYFLAVFAVGFVLGTLRTLLLLKHTGELLAVLIEIPIILGLSWYLCGWVLTKIAVAKTIAQRLLMGGWAFLLLMAAELMVSLLLLGRNLDEHLGLYQTPPVALGLAGQIVFALLPLFRRNLPLSDADKR